MSKPVFKLFMARMTEAGYQLSHEEWEKLGAKHDEVMKKFGVKFIILCNSSWVSEKYHFWGVEEYPDIEAVQGCHAALSEIDWFRYYEAETLLGTRIEQG